MTKLLRKLRLAWLDLLAIPKSLIFNFHYLPWRQAVRLPIWVSHATRLEAMQGKIVLPLSIRTGMIRFGLNRNVVFGASASRSLWLMTAGSEIHFLGSAAFDLSPTLVIEGGKVVVGEQFQANARFSLFCRNRIELGSHSIAAWDVTIMDHDFHQIVEPETLKQLNEPRPVRIGTHVWIGQDTLILKGVEVEPDCVVAARSVLTRTVPGRHQVIGGNPARVLKHTVDWRP